MRNPTLYNLEFALIRDIFPIPTCVGLGRSTVLIKYYLLKEK